MNLKVYVEGGGDGRELHSKCRQGFRSFFCKAGLAGRMPRVIACGGRQKAYDKFRSALGSAKEQEFIVLLVDGEDPVAKGSGPWLHLRTRDNWDKPDSATDDNAHLMVQCMETWFLADKDALEKYFGDGFSENSLPRRREVEDVSKRDIERGLIMATRQSGMGRYHKGRHSFAILAKLDPEKVTAASPHAKRLVDTLLDKAS